MRFKWDENNLWVLNGDENHQNDLQEEDEKGQNQDQNVDVNTELRKVAVVKRNLVLKKVLENENLEDENHQRNLDEDAENHLKKQDDQEKLEDLRDQEVEDENHLKNLEEEKDPEDESKLLFIR